MVSLYWVSLLYLGYPLLSYNPLEDLMPEIENGSGNRSTRLSHLQVIWKISSPTSLVAKLIIYRRTPPPQGILASPVKQNALKSMYGECRIHSDHAVPRSRMILRTAYEIRVPYVTRDPVREP